MSKMKMTICLVMDMEKHREKFGFELTKEAAEKMLKGIAAMMGGSPDMKDIAEITTSVEELP